MHDPKHVAFEIRRPWPKFRRAKRHAGKRLRIRGEWKRGWWDLRPAAFSVFWTIGRFELYWPALITVWHVEPGGRDAGTVCGAHARWHIHHWRIQVLPLQHLRRVLLTRCEECGRKGSPNHSHGWYRERSPWWRGEKGLYHRECSALVSLRNGRELDKQLVRGLVEIIRHERGETLVDTLDALTSHASGWDFALRYRLLGALDAERDDDYRVRLRVARVRGEGR